MPDTEGFGTHSFGTGSRFQTSHRVQSPRGRRYPQFHYDNNPKGETFIFFREGGSNGTTDLAFYFRLYTMVRARPSRYIEQQVGGKDRMYLKS